MPLSHVPVLKCPFARFEFTWVSCLLSTHVAHSDLALGSWQVEARGNNGGHTYSSSGQYLDKSRVTVHV